MSKSQMNIGILGLGLIGGSLGFDLREQGHHIIGVSRQESTCEQAVTQGSVDEASTDMSQLKSAEVIFICTPLGLIVPILEQLIAYLPPTTIVTDVGSVKTPVVKHATSIWNNFIGGHPMAGTAESGIAAAKRKLFTNNPYVLTPVDTTANDAIKILENLAYQLGANIHYCSPEVHDKAVSWISHLPVMVSASLLSACMNENDDKVVQLAQKLASSGFRDTSRVGGGNPELGVMMAKYNRQELLTSLKQYCYNLDRLIESIDREDWESLEQELNLTQQIRPRFTV